MIRARTNTPNNNATSPTEISTIAAVDSHEIPIDSSSAGCPVVNCKVLFLVLDVAAGVLEVREAAVLDMDYT